VHPTDTTRASSNATLTDAAGANTLPSTSSSTLAALLQTVRNCLKWLVAEVGGKAAASHTHTIANVTSLQTTLDGKAPTSHTHTIANVTSLQTTLDGKAPTSHTHTKSQITDFPTIPVVYYQASAPATANDGDIFIPST
jgi:hypothetical protein